MPPVGPPGRTLQGGVRRQPPGPPQFHKQPTRARGPKAAAPRQPAVAAAQAAARAEPRSGELPPMRRRGSWHEDEDGGSGGGSAAAARGQPPPQHQQQQRDSVYDEREHEQWEHQLQQQKRRLLQEQQQHERQRVQDEQEREQQRQSLPQPDHRRQQRDGDQYAARVEEGFEPEPLAATAVAAGSARVAAGGGGVSMGVRLRVVKGTAAIVGPVLTQPPSSFSGIDTAQIDSILAEWEGAEEGGEEGGVTNGAAAGAGAGGGAAQTVAESDGSVYQDVLANEREKTEQLAKAAAAAPHGELRPASDPVQASSEAAAHSPPRASQAGKPPRVKHAAERTATEYEGIILDLRQKCQRLAGVVATLTPSPAAVAANRPPSAGCHCGACLLCVTAGLRAAVAKVQEEVTARKLVTSRAQTLQRQLDSAERIIMELKEENLHLAKENQRARVSVERMAGLFE